MNESPANGDLNSRASEWSVGVRLWVESEGRPLLGPGRLELLEAVDRCHSISAAARQVGMSYRRAWLLIDGMNRAAGTELVTTRTGGQHGGGAFLTDRGRFTVTIFRALLEQVRRVAYSTLQWLTGPDAGAIHVACATSLESVLRQLIVDFSTVDPNISVRAVTGASDELAGHLLAGAPADLFLTADPSQFDKLRHASLIASGSEVTLALNGLAAVGAPRGPAIRSATDLTRAAVKRIALADPACPLGAYTRTYLEPLGLWKAVRERAVFLDNPAVVLAAVQSGQAQVGFVYSSDAAAAGVRVLYRVQPASVRCSAVLTQRGAEKPAAQALLAFLTSRAARTRFRRGGFLPGPGESVISE